VQIGWQDRAGLERLTDGGLAIYAHLEGERGPYALAGATPAQIATLRDEGLAVVVLDGDMAGADYYLAYVMPGQATPAWQAYGRPLLDDGEQVLLRATPEGAQRLAQEGVRLHYLETEARALPRPGDGEIRLPQSVTPEPHVQAMIDLVNTQTIQQYTGDLSGEWPVYVGGAPYTIATRNTYSGEPIDKATQYVGDHLTDLGLSVEYHTWNASLPPNVIGELAADNGSDEIVIVSGHLDDMPSSGPAPGADDNASGSVGVLVAADILTQYRWTCDLRFALWTGEEQGLLGSAVYAQRSANLNENILGVLNLDMIAWNTANSSRDIDLHARQVSVPGSMVLAQLFADVVSAYNIDLIPQIDPSGTGASDHASFWNRGYTAILGIEDFGDFNPYYHTSNDQMDVLDIGYYTDFVRASVGTLAHMGCLPLGAVQGTVTDAVTGQSLADASLSMTDTMGVWYAPALEPGGTYSQTAMAETYSLRAAAPGYYPAVVAGVVISDGVVTVQDVALAPRAALAVTPAFLTATLAPGEVVSQTLWLSNTGAISLAYTIYEGPADLAWLAVDPVSGTLAGGTGQPVAVALDATGLAAGPYAGQLAVTSSDPMRPTATVPVTLTVSAVPMWYYLPVMIKE
jgi:hypothetical protein